MDDILEKTPLSTDQVIIEPDGKWSPISEVEALPKNSHNQPDIGDDDELVEIKDMPRIPASKNKTGSITSPIRKEPTPVPAANSAGGKRSINQVIDLTFSSDETDEPPRTPKRQITNSSSSGLSVFPASENVLPKLNSGSSRDPKNFPVKPFHTSAYEPRIYTEPR